MIDVHFPVLGQSIPADHGYALYSALSHESANLHQANGSVRVGPINGMGSGKGMLQLDHRRSRLRFRLPAEEISMLLPFAGKNLNVEGHSIRLGVPQVHALEPAATLQARLVTIKGFTEPGPFLEAIQRQLDEKEIQGEPAIPLVEAGPHAGKPRRHVLRIKDRRVVGFSLIVTGLTADASIRLQETGLGGRHRMGCGFFLPLRPRST